MPAPASIDVSIVTEVTSEVVAAFARLVPQLSSSAPALDHAGLTEVVTARCNTVLVARDRTHAGEIVGTLTLVVFPIPTGIRAWIEDVIVDSSARGRGVGEALSEEAVRLAGVHGAHTIDLTSRPSREAARRLYERIGFTIRKTDVYRYSAPGKKAG